MKLDRVLNVAITLAMLALVAAVVRRELNGSSPAVDPMDPDAPTEYVDEWDQLIQAGLPLGPLDAPIVIAIFEDLQCPFCKHFHETVLGPLRAALPGAITPVLLHYPIPNHANARRAAHALECAALQGVAGSFVDSIFADQSNMGIVRWTEYARRSGVDDPGAFAECMDESSSFDRIERGTVLGRELEVPGTPTIVVNGMKFTRPPSLDRLRRFADSVMAAREEQ